ncbi:hypothetical protein B0H10DRAFT_2235287 [Mycena sp. CBHHK59/15]|nr:hypothetical protein B0H10DRAFT_2235287 [Mycena sp. CBHHK59/15]
MGPQGLARTILACSGPASRPLSCAAHCPVSATSNDSLQDAALRSPPNVPRDPRRSSPSALTSTPQRPPAPSSSQPTSNKQTWTHTDVDAAAAADAAHMYPTSVFSSSPSSASSSAISIATPHPLPAGHAIRVPLVIIFAPMPHPTLLLVSANAPASHGLPPAPGTPPAHSSSRALRRVAWAALAHLPGRHRLFLLILTLHHRCGAAHPPAQQRAGLGGTAGRLKGASGLSRGEVEASECGGGSKFLLQMSALHSFHLLLYSYNSYSGSGSVSDSSGEGKEDGEEGKEGWEDESELSTSRGHTNGNVEAPPPPLQQYAAHALCQLPKRSPLHGATSPLVAAAAPTPTPHTDKDGVAMSATALGRDARGAEAARPPREAVTAAAVRHGAAAMRPAGGFGGPALSSARPPVAGDISAELSPTSLNPATCVQQTRYLAQQQQRMHVPVQLGPASAADTLWR